MMTMMLAFTTAHASAIPLISSDFKFTGDTYVNGSGSTVDGIGRILDITQGSNIIYSYGENGVYLNYFFQNVTETLAPTAPFYNFLSTGGTVDIYADGSANTFNTLTDTTTEIGNIIADGSLWLSNVLVGQTQGTASPLTYSDNGYLNVTGGDEAPYIVPQSRSTLDGALADITFGLVGNNNDTATVNPEYAYITSMSVQGAAQAVSEPSIMLLMGLGMFFIAMRYNQKTKRSHFDRSMIAV